MIGGRDKGQKGRAVVSIAHNDKFILNVVGNLIGSRLPSRRDSSNDLARTEADNLDRAIAIGGPELAQIVCYNSIWPFCSSTTSDKTADGGDKLSALKVKNINAFIHTIGQIVE